MIVSSHKDIGTLAIIAPGANYNAKLIEVPEINVVLTPVCPRCGNDESMMATFTFIEYVNLAITRVYDGFKCDDCGGEACLTYTKDDAKL